MNDSTKTEVTSGMQAAGYRPKLCYYHACNVIVDSIAKHYDPVIEKP